MSGTGGDNRFVKGRAVSTSNVSTTLLTNGSAYTGTWEDVSDYSSLTVAIKTDQNGTFSVQFSPDGVNQDSTLTRYYRTNQIEAPHRFTITRKYFRVVFTNDSGSDQTYFRLQCLLGDRENLNVPCDSSIAQDYDAIVVRPTDYHYEVALSRRQGHTTWNKFGYNNDVDSAAQETIWSVGGLYQKMSAPDTLDVVSTSANDDSGGTGCTGVIIYGVDENWDTQIEVVTMDGLTPVTTTNQWCGVNRVSIYAAGTGQTNDGVITATKTTGGTTHAQMPAGEGTTQHAFLYVPRNHIFLADWLYLNALKLSGGGNPRVTFKGVVFSNVSNAYYEVFRKQIDTQVENTLDVRPSQPFVVGEQSILEFRAETDTNNTEVSCRFSGILARDADA